MERAVANAIDNALRHATTGRWAIAISASANAVGRVVYHRQECRMALSTWRSGTCSASVRILARLVTYRVV
ncbi:hypothetical protein [Amycolatopsis sp. NPDC021455]|uniref:hypothetical protein n=1 Tax=Amycolatopsis sp. NPDC021455 TaxID=3154901 RepID=UPI0033CF174D